METSHNARFEAFYLATRTALWAYLYRITGDKALTDDLFQETYLRFINAGPWHLKDEQMRAYLYRTATNQARNAWRRQNREQEWVREEESAPNASLADGESFAPQVERALQGLSPQSRSLVWLAYVEGEDHEAIAAALRIKKGSVKVLLHRARQKMQKILRGDR